MPTTFGPKFWMSRAVKGKPFCADMEDVVSSKWLLFRRTQRVKGRVCRDAEGRVRTEYSVSAARLASIYDPVVGLTVALDLIRNTAVQQRVPPADYYADDYARRLPGERRIIEDTHCVAVVQGQISGDEFLESWLSEDLLVIVLEHSRIPGREQTYRLRDIQLVEPIPSLFSVPAGFTVS